MSGLSSIARKTVMSLTGLFLILFLLEHLAGNLLLFIPDGGKAFDAYSEFMSHNAIIRTLEIVLFAGFIFHIVDALALTIQNRKMRGRRYAVHAAPEGSSWFSRNMGITGSIIFIFLVIHLRTFFVETRFIDTDASMYHLVKSAFENPYYSGFYLIAMVLLGFHLAHGFKSAFQTLGLRHKSYFRTIEIIGYIFSIVVPAGFASLPVYFFIKQFI